MEDRMKRINNKSSSVFVIISIIIASSMVFSFGCAKKDGKEIRIGVVLPLSGSAAGHGEDVLGGMSLALEELNDSGINHEFKIKLLIEDNQSTPQGSVNSLNNLIHIHKVPVIIGPLASSDMLAMAPIAEKTKTVLISPGASSPKLSDAGDYIFRNSLLAEPQGEMMAQFCFHSLHKKNVAILYINDETGRGYMGAFEKKFQMLGGKILVTDNFDKQGTDFRTQLAKIKEVKPDAIYAPSTPQTLGYILRQSRELGINATFLANYGVEGEALISIAGETAEGIYYTSIPIDIEFTKKYENVYGRKPTIGAPLGYDTLKLVVKAIKDNGYSSDDIKMGLNGIRDARGATGNIVFDEKGDAIKEIIIKTVKNGSFIEAEF